MKFTCAQCGHDVKIFDSEQVRHKESGERWHLHRGGCDASTYDRWEPTRKLPR